MMFQAPGQGWSQLWSAWSSHHREIVLFKYCIEYVTRKDEDNLLLMMKWCYGQTCNRTNFSLVFKELHYKH